MISVILPVYNAETYLAAAIESVLRQLDADSELIVIDDGSTDKSGAVAQKYPIIYVRQENQGPQHARNKGLSLAQGNIIAFCDADDIWADDKLARQLPLLDSAEIVIGYSQILHATSDPFFLPSLNCALMKRTVFEQIGVFDHELTYSDDLDWYMRAREAGIAIHLHTDVVLHHRRHENNLTNDIKTRDHYQLLMLKKSLDRRRKNNRLQQPKFSDFIEE